MSKYNGWTNYETWRVGLEVINDMNLEDFGFDVEVEPHDLGEAMKSFVEEHIEETSEGLACSYALAFLSEVNWYELATHMIQDAKEEAMQ